MREKLNVVENFGELFGPFTDTKLRAFLKEKGIEEISMEEQARTGSIQTHKKADGTWVRVRAVRSPEEFDYPF